MAMRIEVKAPLYLFKRERKRGIVSREKVKITIPTSCGFIVYYPAKSATEYAVKEYYKN